MTDPISADRPCPDCGANDEPSRGRDCLTPDCTRTFGYRGGEITYGATQSAILLREYEEALEMMDKAWDTYAARKAGAAEAFKLYREATEQVRVK